MQRIRGSKSSHKKTNSVSDYISCPKGLLLIEATCWQFAEFKLENKNLHISNKFDVPFIII